MGADLGEVVREGVIEDAAALQNHGRAFWGALPHRETNQLPYKPGAFKGPFSVIHPCSISGNLQQRAAKSSLWSSAEVKQVVCATSHGIDP